MEKAELVVIGAGPGGYVAAIRAAQLGKKVTLIEEDKVGGICLHRGCIPSKALIYAADFMHKIRKATVMGISAEPSIDFAKTQSWKNHILSKLEKGTETLCKGNQITLKRGRAVFVDSNTVEVQSEKISFDKAIIATGSKPLELAQFPFDEKTILSSSGALSLQSIPENLIVIGGGYIGLELGIVFAKLGSGVSIIELTNQILPGQDEDVVGALAKNLQTLGIQTYLESKAVSYRGNKLTIQTKNEEKEIESNRILVAVGRVPNTGNLGLERTGVKLDEMGFIIVDDKLRTNDLNIYAIGDVCRGSMLAHRASHQGKNAVEIIAGTRQGHIEENVPAVIFTDPEIATVGISEVQARQQGIEITKAKFPLSVSSRAIIKSDVSGFVKIISDKKKEKILGVQIVGPDASDLIGEACLAISQGITVEQLAQTIHPHPTLTETLMEAAEALHSKAIHILNLKK